MRRDPAAGVRSALIMKRTMLGLSQRELADRMGVVQSAVSQMERGLENKPSTLDAWARALGGRVVMAVDWADEIEAAAERAWDAARKGEGQPWEQTDEQTRDVYRQLARVILAP